MIHIGNCTEERCEILAEFIINNKTTVRSTAKQYGISKSTVHKDVAIKLKKINPRLWEEVKNVLEQNKAERHIRGGEATKLKYQKQKK